MPRTLEHNGSTFGNRSCIPRLRPNCAHKYVYCFQTTLPTWKYVLVPRALRTTTDSEPFELQQLNLTDQCLALENEVTSSFTGMLADETIRLGLRRGHACMETRSGWFNLLAGTNRQSRRTIMDLKANPGPVLFGDSYLPFFAKLNSVDVLEEVVGRSNAYSAGRAQLMQLHDAMQSSGATI